MVKRPKTAAATEVEVEDAAYWAKLNGDDRCSHLDHDQQCILPVNHDGAHLIGPRSGEDQPPATTDDTTPIPTEPATYSGELVKTPSNGRGQKYADLTSIVHTAETLRFDAHTTVGLETELDAASDLLALARAQEANREIVEVATLRQLKEHTDRLARQLESWLLQRGIKGNGGGS